MATAPRTPVLHNGDRLTGPEFERRYAAMPDVKKAELVEGVVYMASPVRYREHGEPEHLLSCWLGMYQEATAGLGAASNSTVRLDIDNRPQPDLLLRLPEQAGGRSRIGADGYLEGPPELVAEVAASSVSNDLHQKLHAYRRSGVAEYLVFRVEDGEVDWFVLVDGRYERVPPDADGVLKSRQFPGLWLDVPALLRGDLAALRAAVERGVREPAHAAFRARLLASG